MTPRATRFFHAVTTRPKLVIVLCTAAILPFFAFIPQVERDTRADAFIQPDHPSVVQQERVEELFGLKDPIVVAVLTDGKDGIFNPGTLALVKWLSDELAKLPNVDPDRVASLTTVNHISASGDRIVIEPFFDAAPETQREAEAIREAVMGSPVYLGSLVARDASATLVVATLLDPDNGGVVYDAALELVARAPVNGEELHVAGEGAVNGILGRYLDGDTLRLNPAVTLIIIIVLYLAYRTLRGVLLPFGIVIGAAGAAMGSMVACGYPLYVTTNVMPLILLAIGVADGIHILGQYYEEHARDPVASARTLTIRAMEKMWRPITFTSLTTAVGFMALGLSSSMPPVQIMSLFTVVGVLAAWLMSLLLIPAALSLLKPQGSPAYRSDSRNEAAPDAFGKAMVSAGRWATSRSRLVIVMACIIAVFGAMGFMQLEVNESRIENFASSELLYKADVAIQSAFDGTNYLDVVVETENSEDLFRPDYLRRIEALQAFLETLPRVNGTSSIVDHLKHLNQVLDDGSADAYVLPDQLETVAQYFLLLSTSSNPAAFEELVDYDYRLANVRARMDSGRYSDETVVVEAVEAYLADHFEAPGIRALLAGGVNIDYHWIGGVKRGYFTGIGWALMGLLVTASLCFRSLTAGLMVVAPVTLAVLLTNAAMGFGGVWLGVGTSMSGAIAIGLGVDFALHTVDRLLLLIRDEGRTLQSAMPDLFASTGRALLFSFSALLLGFAVMLASYVPALVMMSMLIAVALIASFIGSLTLLPALVETIRPRFLGLKADPRRIRH